jgi:hypothetical protein
MKIALAASLVEISYLRKENGHQQIGFFFIFS